MSERLLLASGTVLDGQRSAQPHVSDLLIEGDRIARIGPDIESAGARVLDADGLVVAPGFIDSHAHSDSTAFLDPGAQGRVFSGVSTEINGTCGLSLFPLAGRAAAARREALRRQDIEADWDDAGGFLARLDSVGSAINRAFLVGHGALRAAVMGYEARAATDDEIRRMDALLAESLDQGAFGLSSGLCYAPGCFADGREITALCARLASTGRPYCTHLRSEGRALLESAREAVAVCRETGAPLHVSHAKTMGRAHWRKIDDFERILFAARDAGLEVTADRYPYLAAMTDLVTLLPGRLMAGGKAQALERLADAGDRDRLTRELREARPEGVRWDEIRIARASGDAAKFEGLSLSEVAQQLGVPPLEAVFAVLLWAKLSVAALFFDMCEENLERILRWPFVFIGSDAAARAVEGPTAVGKPHPRTFGTVGRFLGEYVRDRRLMELPEAVARLTSLPAARFSLTDRGVLREGAYADIVAFDPDRIRDRATYADPFQLSAGVRHLLVNGRPVLEDGRQTAARPGRALRA